MLKGFFGLTSYVTENTHTVSVTKKKFFDLCTNLSLLTCVVTIQQRSDNTGNQGKQGVTQSLSHTKI